MLKQFRADKYFFLKYYLINLVIYSLGCTLLALTTNTLTGNYGWLWLLLLIPVILPDFMVITFGGLICAAFTSYSETFHWFYLLGFPLGAYLGVQSGTLMHNASHGNLRPKWLNRVCGELCGLHQLPGVPGWWVTHKIHHQNPDDPKRDPHPPMGLTFWQFVRQMKQTMRTVMTNNFFDQWGESKETKRIWGMVDFTLPINRYLRALFMLLLFGPAIFVFVWIPSYLVNIIFYAHLNYATHQPNEDGDYEILDLNNSWYYRFMNVIGQGCYYHKTHHWKPTSINPQSINPTREEPLVSFKFGDENNG
ncbi:MAG: fatty acid desaturase [Verrucomicrobia bacterium]|nr:fatty acid desaturase [Verrucomicrobiota bacterium]MDA1068255.1 fatty acid desaturase [Verrucomicrobiota bacterium]